MSIGVLRVINFHKFFLKVAFPFGCGESGGPSVCHNWDTFRLAIIAASQRLLSEYFVLLAIPTVWCPVSFPFLQGRTCFACEAAGNPSPFFLNTVVAMILFVLRIAEVLVHPNQESKQGCHVVPLMGLVTWQQRAAVLGIVSSYCCYACVPPIAEISLSPLAWFPKYHSEAAGNCVLCIFKGVGVCTWDSLSWGTIHIERQPMIHSNILTMRS